MKTEDILILADKLDKVGYHSLEVWGGATFDSCMRFLNEDPWERLRLIRSAVKNTPLQMLLRGQNLLGYRHYPDDIVEAFVIKARENGIDVFRIFDALNDVRNMQKAMEVAKRVGGHVQATISYTIGPVHTVEGFVEMGKKLAEMGADSICIKDMAGLIGPYEAYDLVSELKAAVDLPIQLHCHYTSGMASMAYLKAIEAGVDVVDTAISTMALGSSQPPTESIVAALKGCPRDTGLDLEVLSEIAAQVGEVRKKYNEYESMLVGVDTNVLMYQIPGGMISNLSIQLAEQGAIHRLRDVLAEVPRVRADLGYPPLVTPSSQIIGVQAVMNVLMGKRYRLMPKEIKDYLKGMYGRPPAPVNEEIRRMAIGNNGEVVDCRPADLLDPEYDKAAEEVKEYTTKPEDIISYAMFPQVALEFFKRRREERGLGGKTTGLE